MEGAQCGTIPNECGGTLSCGPCDGAMTCIEETNTCYCGCGCTDWPQTELLTGTFSGYSVALGADGTEHVVVWDDSVARYVYFRRPSGGTFERIELEGGTSDLRPSIAVGSDGVAHAVYGTTYARIATDGTVETESLGVVSMDHTETVIAPDGTLHVVGYLYESGIGDTLRYGHRTPAGEWTGEVVDDVEDPGNLQFSDLSAVLIGDTLHVAYAVDHLTSAPARHASRSSAGVWTIEELEDGSDSADLDGDADGTLRGIYRSAPTIGEGNPMELAKAEGDGIVTSPIVEPDEMLGFSSIDIDGDDVHIAYAVTPELDDSQCALRHGVRALADGAFSFEEVASTGAGVRFIQPTVLSTPTGPHVYFTTTLGRLVVADRCD